MPGLVPLVKHTVSTLDKVFEFFEELLSCRFPYTTYKQVFVDQVSRFANDIEFLQISDDITSYAGLTILSLNVLYHKKILDVVQQTRTLLAHAVAQQFFGCFVNAAQWLDVWLIRSLSRCVILISFIYELQCS